MRKLVAQTETNTATMPRMRRLVVMRWRMSILAWRASAEMAATKHRALVAAGLWPAVEGDVPPSGHMHRSLRRISDFHAAASGQDARLYGRRGRPPLLPPTPPHTIIKAARPFPPPRPRPRAKTPASGGGAPPRRYSTKRTR